MLTFKEIDENICNWGKEEGWTLSKVENPDYRSVYTVRLTNNNIVVVAIDRIDRIIIQKNVSLLPDAQSSYQLAPNRNNFLYDLKTSLMLLNITVELYPNLEKLNAINMGIFIYFDGFSRNNLINSILKIADGNDLISIMWKKLAESQKPPR